MVNNKYDIVKAIPTVLRVFGQTITVATISYIVLVKNSLTCMG